MLQILDITLPIFALIGIGYLSCRLGLLERVHIAGMGVFVITFALPALLLKAILQQPLQKLLDVEYILGYALGSLLVFAIGFVWSWKLRRDTVTGSALSAMGMSVSNSGFFGYPVAFMVVGQTAGLAMAMIMVVENLLLLPLALILAEVGSQQGKGLKAALQETARRLMRNPIILAVLLGMTLALGEVPVPASAMKVIELLAATSAPVALFMIGGSLYGLRPGGMGLDIAQVSIGKLILHPLLVMAALQLFPEVDPQLKVAAILIACAPMLSIYPIMGARFGFVERTAASLVVATVLAFFTVNSFIAWLT